MLNLPIAQCIDRDKDKANSQCWIWYSKKVIAYYLLLNYSPETIHHTTQYIIFLLLHKLTWNVLPHNYQLII